MAKRILVMDDEEILIRTMNKLLEKKGYEVYCAKNAEDAIVMANEEKFDLAICDIRMPGKNGVETAKVLLSIQPIPLIFMTGFADPVLEKAAQELKPIAYLSKPFDMMEMLQAIERATA